jgi:hypothetical protein
VLLVIPHFILCLSKHVACSCTIFYTYSWQSKNPTSDTSVTL